MLKERFSEVRIETLPATRVACFRAVSKTPEEDALKVLSQWAQESGLRGLPRNFGFDVDVTTAQAGAGMRGYELWFAVPEGVLPAPPITIRDFAGGTYAALTVREPFGDPWTHIPAGWDALKTWARRRGQDPAAYMCLEEIVEHDGARDLVLYLRQP